MEVLEGKKMELDTVLAHTTALEDALTSFGSYYRSSTPDVLGRHSSLPRHIAHQMTTNTIRDRGPGSTIPSQLQGLEKRLFRVLSQSRNLRNTLSGGDGVLPDDVLYLDPGASVHYTSQASFIRLESFLHFLRFFRIFSFHGPNIVWRLQAVVIVVVVRSRRVVRYVHDD